MVTAPVVAYAHLNGVSLHVYLDDWLLNPISEELAKQQTQWLLDLCARLGWVVNVEKSSLTPSQVAIYLGISLDTRVGLAYPSERRIERWLSISEDFLAGQAQPPLHRLKCCRLGCSHGQKDRLRKVVRGHERAAHQCAGTECDLAWSPSLRGYSPRLQCWHYVRQCLCH